MEYCLSIKMNDTLIYDKTCINLGNIVLLKKTEKTTPYCMISFIGNIQNKQIHREKK